jgi:hypothetical protein
MRSLTRITWMISAAVAFGLMLLTAAPSASAKTAYPQAANPAAATSTAGDLALNQLKVSAAELTAWQAQTATPAGRAHVVERMQAAFAGIATVGTDPQYFTQVTRSGGGTLPTTAVPNLATGITGDHFWIIVSYADVANGLIAVAVRACQTRLPGWLCTAAGNLLSSWAQGGGSASNHGVWAAIYWLPPHIDGGSW